MKGNCEMTVDYYIEWYRVYLRNFKPSLSFEETNPQEGWIKLSFENISDLTSPLLFSEIMFIENFFFFVVDSQGNSSVEELTERRPSPVFWRGGWRFIDLSPREIFSVDYKLKKEPDLITIHNRVYKVKGKGIRAWGGYGYKNPSNTIEIDNYRGDSKE